jgi:hypothetical protein
MNVCADSAGAAPLINNRITTGPWETFALVPVPVMVTATLSGLDLTLAWPVNYLGWILQTNSLGLAATAAWGDLAGSQASNEWTIPITNSALPLQFFRLRHP